jgi:hypothetical protein
MDPKRQPSRHWKHVVCLLTVLLSGPAGDVSAEDRCAFNPALIDAELVERAWTCRASPEWRRALVARGGEVAPHVLALGQRQAEARGWALSLFEDLGPAGDATYASLGSDLVEWRLEGSSSGDSVRDDERLRQLGAAATPRLLKHLRDVCETGNARAIEALGVVADPRAAEGLAEVAAAQRGCEARLRVVAAQLLVRLDRARGVSALEQLLRDPNLPQERGAVAKTLARSGGTAGVAPAIEVLKDPAVPRSQRWDIAVLLRATGIPEAVAAADRYQPAGRRGTGNPESPFGAWLTMGLLGASMLLLAVWPREDRLTRPQRIVTVGLAVAGAHLIGVAVYVVVGATLTFYASPVLVIGTIAVGTLIPLAVALSAIRRVWGLTGVSTLMLAAGAVLGLLAGCYLDEQIYWYAARKDQDAVLVRFFSPLQQAVAWTLPLAASYWPLHPLWPRGTPATESASPLAERSGSSPGNSE